MSVLTNRIAAPGSFSKRTHDLPNTKVSIANFPGKSISRRKNYETISRTLNRCCEAPTEKHISIASIKQKKHSSDSKINRLEDELIRKVVEMKTMEALMLKVTYHSNL